MTDHLSEYVLCIPSSKLDKAGRFQGFSKDAKVLESLFADEDFAYLSRSEVESDESVKQLVTYSIVAYGPNPGNMVFFSYTRGGPGGEDRLKRKLSVGIGGHVSGDQVSFKLDPDDPFPDMPWYNRFRCEAMREIDEEISHNSRIPRLNLWGLINDDSDPVGRVHLGLVFVFTCTDPDIGSNDEAVSDGRMLTYGQIMANYDRYESWSKIVIDSVIKPITMGVK